MHTDSKRCPTCQRTLSSSDFYVHPSHSDGLSSSCKECTRAYNRRRYHDVLKHDLTHKERTNTNGREWYENNRDRSRARIQRTHRQQREQAIAAYGGCCQCCGENRYEFLALDHATGGGNRHRKQVGNKIVRWLAKQGFPQDIGIRILCHNCNSALAYYGYCPHQESHP